MRTAVGDVALEESPRGRESGRLVLQTRPRDGRGGDAAFVDEAARTTVWCSVTDEATAGRSGAAHSDVATGQPLDEIATGEGKREVSAADKST